MSFLVLALAILGFLAIARNVALAGMRLLGRGVERLMAGEVAEARARRGDLTGVGDAEGERVSARRRQRAALAVFAFWGALLVAPVLSPWPRYLYAVCSVLWLLPRIRPGRV